MKKKLIFFLILGTSFIIHAQKTAFINEAKLLAALPGYTNALKEIDSIKKVFETEISSSKETLNKKLQTLLSSYKLPENATLANIEPKLSDLDKQKLELYKEEGQLIEKQIQNKQTEYENNYKLKVGKLVERVNDVIKTYCKENKIDILLKIDALAPSIAYYEETKEVTKAIIAKIK